MSCIADILTLFASPYGDHLATLPNYTNEFVSILEISGAQIPQEYVSSSCSDEDLSDAHSWLIKYTQENFFARKGERWETTVPEWIHTNSDYIFEKSSHFINFFISEKAPDQNDDCVAILGATRKESEQRIDNTIKLVAEGQVKPDAVYLLTGQRFLQPKELSNSETAEIAKTTGKEESLTEADMMSFLYKSKTGTDATLVDATACNLPLDSEEKCSRSRPNTEDTLEAFLAMDQTCQRIAFVSRAPNTYAQAEAVAHIMKALSPETKFEVIGGSADPRELPAHMKFHALHHILMPFAGALWGSFERISTEIAVKLEQCPAEYEYLNSLKESIKSEKIAKGSEFTLKLP